MLALAELLIKHGHDVVLWGTDDQPMIHDSRFMIHEDLLVDYLNFDRRDGLWQDIRKVGQMVWSTEAAEKFDDLLDAFAPEIIHLHNIYHHISPSILPVAARHKVPVVMTVHDWHLINPNYSLFDHGQICERDGLRAVARRCIKNSYLATLADVIEMKIHRALRVYERYVERFLAPTPFVKQKLVEGGFDEKKIEVVPLGVNSKLETRNSKLGDYILYAGRLAEEKGVKMLLDVAKALPEIKFRIAGTGPLRQSVELRIKDEELSNIEMLGFLEKGELQKVIAQARLILVPSLWYEVSPLAVLEAMAQGKVVLASKVGALANLIAEGKTGFLVGANYESISNLRISNSQIRKFEGHSQFVPLWVDKIKKLWHDTKLLEEVGSNAKAYIKQVHDPQNHYEKIMEIYRRVIRY